MVTIIQGETYAFNIKGAYFDITQVNELQVLIAKNERQKVIVPDADIHVRGDNEIQVVLNDKLTANLTLGYHDLEFRWEMPSSKRRWIEKRYINIINSYYGD